MQWAEMRLLAMLPKVELAKLAGDIQEVKVQPGESVVMGDGVLVVSSGQLELLSDSSGEFEPISLGSFGSGEVLTHEICAGEKDSALITAVTESVLYRVSLERWEYLLKHYPALNDEIQKGMVRRLHTYRRDLIRYKRYVYSYANELWPQEQQTPTIELAEQEVAATEVTVLASSAESGSPPQAKKATGHENPHRRTWIVGLVTALFVLGGVGGWFLLGGRGTELLIVALILGWTAVNWYLHFIPDYVVALSACLFTVSFGISGATETFIGFADPAWFLLLGAFGLGAAIHKSGLLYRTALLLLRVLPPTYQGQATALALAGTLLTPALPSVQSRVAIAGLLSREMSEAMRFPACSKGSAGLAMSAFLGFGQMRFLFLNGSSYSLLAWGLLPLAVRQAANWGTWLLAAMPMGLLILFLTHWLTIRVHFRENGAVISRDVINRQLSILGEMSGQERITMWMMLAVVAGFALQPLHHVDPGWVALGGFLLLVVLGVLDKEQVATKVDWQYLLFYGSLAGMVGLITKSGLSAVLARNIAEHLASFLTNEVVFLLGAAFLIILLRLMFQPAPAIILTAVALYPLSMTLGFNPLLVAVTLVAASTTWLIPQLLNSYTTMYAATQGKCFRHAQVRTLSVIHSAIILISILGSVPYWYLLGFIGNR